MKTFLAFAFLSVTSTGFAGELTVDQSLISCGLSRSDTRSPSETESCTTASALPEARFGGHGTYIHVAPNLAGGRVGVSANVVQDVNVGALVSVERSATEVADKVTSSDARTYGVFAWGQLGHAEYTVAAERTKSAATYGTGVLRGSLLMPLVTGSAQPYLLVGVSAANGDVAGQNANSYGATAGLGLRVNLK